MARPTATARPTSDTRIPTRFIWDIDDVEFEPGSGNGKPLVPDNLKHKAKLRLRQAKAAAPVPRE